MTTSEPKAPIGRLRAAVSAAIDELQEKHRLHRKIRFLLDVRGLLVINRLAGDYAEFGIYRGEMMYAASRVLGALVGRYIGLDTFAGLPTPAREDGEHFVFEREGFMAADRDLVEGVMAGAPCTLIEGDFRDAAVVRQFQSVAGDVAVASIDCNWPSSVEAALHAVAPHLRCGSIVYLDDYFTATRRPNFHRVIFEELEQRHGLALMEFMTYPPCGRAFLVERP